METWPRKLERYIDVLYIPLHTYNHVYTVYIYIYIYIYVYIYIHRTINQNGLGPLGYPDPPVERGHSRPTVRMIWILLTKDPERYPLVN